MRRVAILGAGNGAQTMAGHLASHGHDVSLFEHPSYPEKIREINAKGNNIVLTNAIETTGKLRTATTDIGEVLRGAEIIFFVAPSFAQKPIFELALPYFEEEQTLVIIPGNFGSLALRKMMTDSGIKKHLYLAECDTLPYACRLIENGKCDVWGVKDTLLLGTLPGNDFDKVWENLDGVFPIGAERLSNPLGAGLSNANMVAHCATILMNAGRVESEKGAFRFYVDGMTPSVCRVQEAVDAERVGVARGFGIELKSIAEKTRLMYRLSSQTLYELVRENPAYTQHGNDAPREMNHRYLTEDVPYLLVPLSEFGRIVGYPTPVADSIINLANIVNGVDYRAIGLNLEKLGLAGLSKEEIIKKVSE
jgi:opine dehydrogenase